MVVQGCYYVDPLYAEPGREENSHQGWIGLFYSARHPLWREVVAGTRTIKAFGGHRANRVKQSPNG